MNQAFSIFFSIYFLLGSMIPYTDFSQLLLLADTSKHYLEHKDKAQINGEEFCPVEFIIEHYLEKNHEEDNHDNLPLHSYNSSIEFICAFNWLHIEDQLVSLPMAPFCTISDVVISDYSLTLERPPSLI